MSYGYIYAAVTKTDSTVTSSFRFLAHASTLTAAMAPSSPVLPNYSTDSTVARSNWLKRIIHHLKLIRKNPGGGAAKRLMLVLLTAVLGSLVVFTFSLSVSPSLLFRC